MSGQDVAFDVVIPTVGRPSLATLVRILDRDGGRVPERLIVVDDRTDRTRPLPLPPMTPALRARLEIVASGGRGPAAARNAGWRAGAAPWIAFVDDDVEPGPGWLTALGRDLRRAAPDVAGVQGSITVPLPAHRRPTDWERNVAALERAPWITADLAYRRDVLERVGGFDERFPRAYREDTDLALRVQALGLRLMYGRRSARHPVRPTDAWVSVRLQRGNADDVLLRALHPDLGDGPTHGIGRRPWHAVTVGAFVVGACALALGATVVGTVLVTCWVALTGVFAWKRIAPGPRTGEEIATMIATSVVLPFAVCLWWLAGVVRLPRLLADRERAPRPSVASAPTVEAAS